MMTWIVGGFAAVLAVVATGAVASPPPLVNPPEVASTGAVLNGTLTVAPGAVEIAGRQLTTTVYNGTYMPPCCVRGPAIPCA